MTCSHTCSDSSLAAAWAKARTRIEPECYECAGVTRSSAPRVAPHAWCSHCKSGRPAFHEKSVLASRTHYFCDAACQRAFYASGKQREGAPSLRSVVVGALGPWLEHMGNDHPDLTRGEQVAADHFFQGNDALMSAHERVAATNAGVPLDPYPSSLELLTALGRIHMLYVSEANQHYAFPGAWRAAGSSGSRRSAATMREGHDRTVLNISPIQFIKAALMAEIGEEVESAYTTLVDALEMLEAHPRQDAVDRVMVSAAVRVLLSPRPNPKPQPAAADGGRGSPAVPNFSESMQEVALARADQVPLADDIADGAVYVVMMRLASKMMKAGYSGSDVTEIFGHVLNMAGIELTSSFDPTPIDNWLQANVNRMALRPRAYTDRFALTINLENLGDIAAGLRVSALVHSRISPAFTPVTDFWLSNGSIADGTSGNSALFYAYTVSPANSTELVVPTPQLLIYETFVNMVRSLLGQTMLALEAAQHHLRFTHWDLHTSNLMILQMPEDYLGAYFMFQRPVPEGTSAFQHRMFIPTQDTGRGLVRIIDYGRARADHPAFPGQEDKVTFTRRPGLSMRSFDHSVDVRTVGYHIGGEYLYMAGWLNEVVERFNRARGGESQDALDDDTFQMVEVFETMVNMRNWTYLAQPLFPQDDRPPAPWRENMPPPTFLAFLMEMQNHGRPFYGGEVSAFRSNEIFGPRQDSGTVPPSPAQILDMPFFDRFRVMVEDNPNVDFIGDATLPLRT